MPKMTPSLAASKSSGGLFDDHYHTPANSASKSDNGNGSAHIRSPTSAARSRSPLLSSREPSPRPAKKAKGAPGSAKKKAKTGNRSAKKTSSRFSYTFHSPGRLVPASPTLTPRRLAEMMKRKKRAERMRIYRQSKKQEQAAQEPTGNEGASKGTKKACSSRPSTNTTSKTPSFQASEYARLVLVMFDKENAAILERFCTGMTKPQVDDNKLSPGNKNVWLEWEEDFNNPDIQFDNPSEDHSIYGTDVLDPNKIIFTGEKARSWDKLRLGLKLCLTLIGRIVQMSW